MSKSLKNKNYIDMAKDSFAEDTIKAIVNDERKIVRYRNSRPINDLRELLLTSCQEFSDRVAFYEKRDGNKEYTQIKYSQLQKDVNSFGTYLHSLALQGEKIGVIGVNSYRWSVSYLATVCGTGIIVPFDKEFSNEKLVEMVKESQIKAIICDEKYEELLREQIDAPDSNLKFVIAMNVKDIQNRDKDKLSFEECITKGEDWLNGGNRSFVDAKIKADELSILLYTSGTTGKSKGVMLSHHNIVEDIMVAPTLLHVDENDIFFSVLPVHHTYECTCGFLLPLYKGAAIGYCQGLKYIAKNLKELRPTIFLGVPAIFEALHKKIWQEARKSGKEKTLQKAIKITKAFSLVGINLKKKLFKNILDIFGGRLRIMISGGAPINPDIIKELKDFGLFAVQGYGLTECAPLAALNPDCAPIDNSIGVPFPNMEIKIIDKDEKGIGEICVKGRNVMMGYLDMPEETAQVLDDGWLKTGDLGYIDSKGYVYITGRKKNLIITGNGENVSPEELENEANKSVYILESMAFQSDKDNIALSVVIDWEEINSIHGEGKLSKDDVEKLIWEDIDLMNKKNPTYMRIVRVIIKDELIKNTTNKIIRFNEENK